MQYYYYTKWTLSKPVYDNDIPGKTVYHSTWVSEQSPKEFLASCTDDVIFFQRFNSEEELRKFASTVGLGWQILKPKTLALIMKFTREPASRMPRGCTERRIYADFLRQEKGIIAALRGTSS